MDSAVQHADRFEQLLEKGEDGPYVFSQMFSADGWRARSRSKKTFKLLKKIDAPLREMLREDERVFYVTRGIAQPRILEWYFLGAALYYLNQRAIVLTNQRILLLQINWRQDPREMRNQIAYTSVSRVKSTWDGSAKIQFHSGGKVVLNRVPKADRKWMVEIFEKLLGRLDGEPSRTELENLCPHCYRTVEGMPAACPDCGGRFKSPKLAGLLSLVFPGAGDMYLGHNGFAYMEIAGATVMWLVIASTAFAPDVSVLAALIVLVVFAVLAHGIDAFTTHRMATKGLIPDHAASHRWRFGAAAVIPVLGVGIVLAAAPGKARLRPDSVVVTGEQLPTEHLEALLDAGYVDPDESVLHFYSPSTVSILQAGNVVTDRRVVAYVVSYDDVFHESAPFEEIADLMVEPSELDADGTRVTVVRGDGRGFYFFLGKEGGGDERFVETLTDRWRSTRTATGGRWFDGGTGTSADGAVVVHHAGVDPLNDAVAWWMSWWYGTEGTDWTLRTRSEGDGTLKYLIELPGGESRTLLFEDAGA